MIPSTPDQDFPAVQSAWSRTTRIQSKYEAYWSTRRGVGLPVERFREFEEVWMDVGAGTGGFFEGMARRHPRTLFIAVERDRMRGKALAKRGRRAALSNFLALRGNVIPTLIAEVPAESLDRVFLLYPCPWPKNSQRKNRWYNHPVMAHITRALKPGGLVVWASDQKWYIDEARFACEKLRGLEVLAHGPLEVRPENGREGFPAGRTKFEATFLALGHPCHELILRKPDARSQAFPREVI